MPIKKSIAIGLVLIFFLAGNVSFVEAQSLGDAAKKAAEETKKDAEKQINKQKEELAKTAEKSKNLLQNLGFFFLSFVSLENPLEDFADIFRNQCQLDDIDRLQIEMDKIRKNLKQAALRGDEKEYNALKNDFVKTALELYFVRNFIDTKNGQFIIENTENLTKKLEDKFFAPNLMDRTTILAHAGSLILKYGEALKTYKECNVFKDWERVVKNWKSFTEALQKSGEDFKNTISEPFKSKKDEPLGAKKDAVKLSAKEIVGQYLSEHIGISVPKLPQKILGASDLDRLKQIFSSGKSTDMEKKTLKELETEISSAAGTFAVDQEIGELKAKYDILYGEGGDSSAKALLKELSDFNQTIDDANKKIFPKVIECAKKPNEMQCANLK